MIKKMMFIDGKWVDSLSGKTMQIVDPGKNEVIAVVPLGGREDARRAIAAARKAFDEGEWRHTTPTEKGRMVSLLGDLVEKYRQELAELESLDTGKTVTESLWDMDDIAGIFRYYGELADKDSGEIIASPVPNSSSMVVHEPIGVCGQISPWNYPLLQASWKMAPALAAGCTVIMKPSEITPLTTIRITELAQEAGFPPGVVNMVTGPGHSAGAELSENHDVDLISFTGGIETGRKIIRAASGNVKKLALELGGKNPNIIFEDAGFDTAADYVLNGVFFHAGQICSAGARVMVHSSLHDRLIKFLVERIGRIRVGYGFDKETQMGPVISRDHLEKVEKYVAIGQQEGARLEIGGTRPDPAKYPDLQKGFYFMPTLFTGCTNDMKIVQEEIFGPVITVEKFETEDEVVKKANDTVYGLSAGFWTRDPDRIGRVSKALKFGTVWVNDFNVYFTQAPWGGYKQSGIGRELGKTGLEEYMEIKHIFQNYDTKPINWFGK